MILREKLILSLLLVKLLPSPANATKNCQLQSTSILHFRQKYNEVELPKNTEWTRGSEAASKNDTKIVLYRQAFSRSRRLIINAH